MKTIALLAVTSLALVGCNKQNDMGDSANAQKDQIEQSKDAQKEALNQEKKGIEQSADQAQDQISAQAKAEKERIEAQADAQQAQIDAQKKQVEAQAAAAKAEVNAQEKINEAAGAAPVVESKLTAQDQGTSDADRKIVMEIRQSVVTQQTPTDLSLVAKNVTIITKDGVVTLKGSVKTEAEKADLEARAKAVSGVKSVDNKLEVKAE
ncbi:MAG: BON domain-containing protein [Verrucomicrobiota bacterium]